jgi:NADH-quinone oxidoreductase subunit M
VLQAAMTGVFCARDLILFYTCFEFTLIPMFVLISLYGSTNRKAAAIKFFLYTFTGSVIALAGLVYVAWFNATARAHDIGRVDVRHRLAERVGGGR